LNSKDFTCPLSGEVILSDPVTLNGYVYDKDTLEDWIYRSDWLDPFYIFDNHSDSSSVLTEKVIKENQVDPSQILECSPDFMELFHQFHESQQALDGDIFTNTNDEILTE